MKRGRRTTPEQIIAKLRAAELKLAQGMSLEQVCRELEMASNTYYRWKKQYGGMEVSQARRLKKLEQENVRLKKLVAEQALDNAMLKEVAEGNF